MKKILILLVLATTISGVAQEKDGLRRMKRQHVHLSADEETAARVGSRRKGTVVVLKIAALEMYNDCYRLRLSRNNVWLTGSVPRRYICSRANDRDTA